MDIEKKIYTFEYTFKNPDYPENNELDATQFCTETKREADRLFKDFLKEEGLSADIKPENVEVVYNEDDAEEYGKDYGTPDDYNAFQDAYERVASELNENIDLYIIEGSAKDDSLILRDFYYNPNSEDGKGTIEEDVLYYNDSIKEFAQNVLEEGEIAGFDGRNYYYPLDTVDGIATAESVIQNIKDTLNGKAEHMLVVDNKEQGEKLHDFICKHLDAPTKEKENNEPER